MNIAGLRVFAFCILGLVFSCVATRGIPAERGESQTRHVQTLGSAHLAFDEEVASVALSDDGRDVLTLLRGRSDKASRLDLTARKEESRRPRIVTEFSSRMKVLAMASRGRAFVCDGKRVVGVAIENGATLFSAKLRETKQAPRLAISPSSKFAACWSEGYRSTVEVWHLGTGRVVEAIAPPDLRVRLCGFVELADRTLCLVLADDLHVWSLCNQEWSYERIKGMKPGGLTAVCPVRAELCLARLADGSMLIQRYDLATREWSDLAKRRWFSDVAYSPDGMRIGALSDQGLEIWRTDSVERVSRIALALRPPPVFSSRLAIDPSGRWVAVYGGDHRVKLVDLADKRQTVVPGHSIPVTTLKWAREDSTIVSGANDVRIWRISDGREVGLLKMVSPLARVDGVDVSDDSQYVATSSYESSGNLLDRAAYLSIHDLATHRLLRRVRQNDWPVHGVSFAGDCESVLYGSFRSPDDWASLPRGHEEPEGLCRRTVRSWDLLRSMNIGNACEIRFVATPDIVATDTTGDGNNDLDISDVCWLSVFDARNGRRLGQYKRFGTSISALTVTNDGASVIAGYADGSIETWKNPKLAGRIHVAAHDGPVSDIAVDHQGHFIATVGGKRGTVRLWDPVTWKLRHEIITPSRAVCASFAHGGSRLGIGHRNGVITVWDVEQ